MKTYKYLLSIILLCPTFAHARMVSVNYSIPTGAVASNDYGWMNENDMYYGLNKLWNVYSGKEEGSAYYTWADLKSCRADESCATGIPNACYPMDGTFFEDDSVKAAFGWLLEYMQTTAAAQGKTLELQYSSYLRYNLQAFFNNGVRDSWPRSADYTTEGVSTPSAYQPYWKHAFNNPTTFDTDSTIKLNQPFMENNYFVGWFFNSDGTGEQIIELSDKCAGKTLYAVFSNDAPWTMTDSTLYVKSYYFNNVPLENRAAIKNVVFLDNIVSIVNHAFSGCTSLTSITIPNSVTSIGNSAFSGCTGLTSITIPYSVTSIGNNAFYDVPNVAYNGSADGYPWGARCVNGFVDGYLVYKDNTKTNLAVCSVSALGDVIIPNSVTTIENSAFRGCRKLTSVSIPNSVTYIGERAFRSCTHLKSINIPDSITSIAKELFMYCNELTTIFIPSNVTSIGYGAFDYCSGLTSITIPNSVISIESYAFYGCTNLTTVINSSDLDIQTGYESHGYVAYYANKVYQGVPQGDFVIYKDTIVTGYLGTGGNVTIPEGIKQIGSDAFSYCSGLTSITIPNSVTYIESEAFYGCTNLATVINSSDLDIQTGYESHGYVAYYANKVYQGVPQGDFVIYKDTIVTGYLGTGGNVTIPEGIKQIGSDAFSYCSGLTSVSIGNSVTSIGRGAFRGCTGLTSITIPNSVTLIKVFAFSGCDNLTSVTWNAKECLTYFSSYFGTPVGSFGSQVESFVFGDSVQVIPDCICRGMTKLTSITIPNSVTSIESSAFYGCTSLTSITIPNSVTSIEEMAFGGCDDLISVTFMAPIPPSLGYQSFDNLRNIYVDCKADLNAYKQFFGEKCQYFNKHYTHTLNTISGGKIISNNEFACDDEEVILTAVPDFGYRFVQWNTGSKDDTIKIVMSCDTSFTAEFIQLDTITGKCGDNLTFTFIPKDSILTITGSGAMDDNIHDSWLRWADAIKAIVLSDSITYIGANAFVGCNLVKELILPKSLVAMGDGALYGCTNIRSITCEANQLVSVQSYTLYGISQYAKVYVLDELLEDYQFDINWSKFTIQSLGKSYTLTVNAVHGSVSGGGKYSSGRSAVLTATPEHGYHFLQWNDSVTSNPRTVIVTCDTLFVAEFAKNTYSVLTYADHGTITAPSQCLYMENVSLSVVPDKGWSFSQWSDGNKDNPRVATITSDTTFTAIFEPQPYSFTVQTADAKKGSVQGNNGTYPNGTVVPISATGEYGYQFSHWSDGNTDNPRQYTITDDVTLIAYFEADGGSCGDNLTWRFDVTTGTLYISGSGSMDDYPSQSAMPWNKYCLDIRVLVLENGISHIGNYAFYGCNNLTSVTIPNTVISIGKYAFAECTKLATVTLGAGLTSIGDKAFYNDYRIEKITSYATTMTPEVGIDAFYNVSKQYVYLYVSNESQRKYQVDPNWNGFDIRVIGAESSSSDGNVSVTPSANDATFTWPANDKAEAYSLEITKDGVVFCTLKFNAQGQLIGIAFAPGINGNHRAPAAVMTTNGWQFTVTGLNAASKYGFTLDAKDNSQQIIKSYSGQFATTGYQAVTYTLTLSVNDATRGTVSGAGEYGEFDKATATAIANVGYEFVQWSNGVTDNPYTFSLESDTELEAVFAVKSETSLSGLNNPASTPVKFIQNGQLYILRDGKTYTVQGVEIE